MYIVGNYWALSTIATVGCAAGDCKCRREFRGDSAGTAKSVGWHASAHTLMHRRPNAKPLQCCLLATAALLGLAP